MDFVILWTDYFVYLLVFMTLWVIYYCLNHDHLRHKWLQVIRRPINLVAILVLLVYCTIGLLDSIHFNQRIDKNGQGSTGIVSVLDVILKPLIDHPEKTYSAPFATHGFSKESITIKKGQMTRDFPKLVYGGAHLKHKSKAEDLRSRIAIIALQSIVVWGALSVLLILWGAARHGLNFEYFFGHVIKGHTKFPWRTCLLTIGLIIFVTLFIAQLMGLYHILGTDQVGEDVLYQSLKSIRTGLVIGTLTTIVMLPFAILLGMLAGYFKSWIDDIVQYTYTTLSSIPGVLLIAAAVLTLQIVMDRNTDYFQNVTLRADARLLALCAILGITSWTELCRYIRGETLKITQMDFVTAAYSLGVSHNKILWGHLLPNVTHIVLITVVLNFSGLVLAEAVLSYVGVGVDPNTYSWGMMINSARMELARVPVVWWSLAAAFIFMFLLVLAANIFSDALQDVFDPRSHLEHDR
jgi:peptide/nickel transport system permease protein